MILIAYFEQLSQTKLLRQQRGMYSHFQFRLLYYPDQFFVFHCCLINVIFSQKMYLEKVHLIGAKDEDALSIKGGMLSHALLIATFVAYLF